MLKEYILTVDSSLIAMFPTHRQAIFRTIRTFKTVIAEFFHKNKKECDYNQNKFPIVSFTAKKNHLPMVS